MHHRATGSWHHLLALALLGATLACAQPQTGDPLLLTVTDVVSKAPLAGARLAIDLGHGERREAITGPDGTASIKVDWTQGAADVTVWADTYTTQSQLAVARATHLELALGPIGRNERATSLSGGLLHRAAETDTVLLTSDVSHWAFQGSDPSYQLYVKTGVPFTIIAADFDFNGAAVTGRGLSQRFRRWLRLDRPALSGVSKLDIDFTQGTQLLPVRAAGRMEIPGGKNSALGLSFAYAYVHVTTLESRYALYIGAPEQIDIADDNNGFFWNLQYVKLDGVTPLTQYGIYDDARGSSVGVSRYAWPVDGEHLTDLPSSLEVTSPATGAALAPGAQVLVSGGIAAPAVHDLRIFDLLGNEQWRVSTGGRASVLKLPALPNGVTWKGAFLGARLYGQVLQCAEVDRDYCGHYSESPRFDVQLP